MLPLLLFLVISDAGRSTVLLKQGLVALGQAHLTEARRSFEEAAKIDSQNAYIWSSLAETYLRLKLPRQASAAAVNAEKIGSKDPLICHALAMYYSDSGRFDRAAALERTFAESPRADPDALSRAASLYLTAGDSQAALQLAKQALAQRPTPENEDLAGRALIAAGQEIAGTEHLQSAWQASKGDPRIAFDLAQAFLHREDFTQAADVVSTALVTHPQDVQLTLALGVARYGQRRFEDSIRAFLKTIAIDPFIQQPYFFMSRMLEQAGPQLGEITKDYEALVARDPKNAKAQLLLARALLTEDRRDERAFSLLQNSIVINPKDWESHFELGVCLEERREYAAAESELSRSVVLAPEQALPHYHLARVYDRLGDSQRAGSEREIHRKLAASVSRAGVPHP